MNHAFDLQREPGVEPRAGRNQNRLAIRCQRTAHVHKAPVKGYSCEEQEIRRLVLALARFDKQILRAMGIRSRSDLEFTVRFCLDC